MAETQQPAQQQQDIKNNTVAAAARAPANNAKGPAPARNTADTTITVDSFRINPRYFSSIPGILKVIEWVFAIICIACSAPALFSGAHWFLFVVVFCFIFTFIWMCVHFFTITSVITQVPWLLIEMSFTAAATVLYFIAMVVMLTLADNKYKPELTYLHGASRWEAYIAAGCFALFNTIVYAIETLYHAQAWREARNG